MPERNHEVVIDGYVFPDTVTVTLANDEYVNSRDYVSKELYESVFDANDAWQSENSKLREQVTQLQDDWESERDYADQMEAKEKRAVAENVKLRELVRKYGEYTNQDRCEGCVCKSRCNDGDIDECWQLTEIRELARELRVEVK